MSPPNVIQSDKPLEGSAASIAGSCIDATPKQIHSAALAYLAAGLSFLPISADLTKMPAFKLLPQIWCEKRRRHKRSWGVFRARQPTASELHEWYEQSDAEYGLAVLGGAVSGNLEIIDLDTFDLAKPYRQEVKRLVPGLWEKLIKIKTPRPGLHLYYRCEQIGGNQKLARVSEVDATGKRRAKTTIETKGEGGYCLAPPSPRRCHPRERCYTYIGNRDLTAVSVITPRERDALLEIARGFNQWKSIKVLHKPQKSHRARSSGHEVRPGDTYAAYTDWDDILEPHGWAFEGDDGADTAYWCRPGKTWGVSATTNFGGSDLLYVFSENADPFEARTAYTKFSAYTLLEHDGNFTAAARELASMGYGRRPSRTRRSESNDMQLYAGYKLRSRRH